MPDSRDFAGGSGFGQQGGAVVGPGLAECQLRINCRADRVEVAGIDEDETSVSFEASGTDRPGTARLALTVRATVSLFADLRRALTESKSVRVLSTAPGIFQGEARKAEVDLDGVAALLLGGEVLVPTSRGVVSLKLKGKP
jgi:hypothetical protein